MSSDRPALRLDWCSYDAARHAVERWHYSRTMPAGKTVKIGVWEADQFTGVIIFSRGANHHIGSEFGMTMTECCELTRVALRDHAWPVTRMLAIALRMLKRQSPGVQAVISYADCDQDHHGGIYAGGGWLYLGQVQLNGGTPRFLVRGRVMHGRSVHARGWKQNRDWLRRYIDPQTELVYTRGKHKYVWPFADGLRQQLAPLVRPYLKRAAGDATADCAGSIGSDAPASQAGEGGAAPTPALVMVTDRQTGHRGSHV